MFSFLKILISPGKKRRTGELDLALGTPSKRLRTNDVLSLALTPTRSSSKLQESPHRSSPSRNKPNFPLSPIKHKSNVTPVKEPAKRGMSTPQKINLRSTPSQKEPDEKRSVDNGRQKRELKKVSAGFFFSLCLSKEQSTCHFQTGVKPLWCLTLCISVLFFFGRHLYGFLGFICSPHPL